jgi:hypothetical protein
MLLAKLNLTYLIGDAIKLGLKSNSIVWIIKKSIKDYQVS